MKRYTLLILTVLMLAPLLPLAEPTDGLDETPLPSLTSGQFTVALVDTIIPQLVVGGGFTCSILMIHSNAGAMAEEDG